MGNMLSRERTPIYLVGRLSDVASYRRRMGVIAVREMARHRYRQSQYAGLTRLQLDEVGRERQVQRQGARRAEALAEWSVELAQAMVPQARG